MSARELPEIVTGFLPKEHYESLSPYFEAMGVPVPDPDLSSIAFALDGKTGELLGFWPLQTCIHAEPPYIIPEHRHNEVWRKLAEKVQEPFVPGSAFYVFLPPDRPELEHMAISQGMKILDWKVAVKEF